MRIAITILVVSAAALCGFTSALADVTVSGEAKAYSSQVSRLQLSVNASGGDGIASGSAQYTRLTAGGAPELELDMPVSCMWVADDAESVVMAGPATVTSNPRSAAVDEWFVIALQKRPAEKERIRTLFATQREAAAKCASGETLFPAIVDSGGFEITQGESGQSNMLGTGRDVDIDPDRVGGSRDFPLPVPALGAGGAGESAAEASSSRCSAHFRFDGNLDDSTGGGHDAMMVDLDRLPTGSPAQFQSGKFGQALRLTGDSVAVAPLDLHFDDCPKVTISAWVHLLSEPSGQMTIVSTGYGAGPRLALTKSNASAWGGANEIRTRSRDWTPEVGMWFPIVAVWDYESGMHTLYMRGDDGALTEELGNYSREPQQDLWIGTYAYGSSLMNVGADILIDDLRIYDRILQEGEIAAALEGDLPVASCDCEADELQQRPLSGTLGQLGDGLGRSEFPEPIEGVEVPGNTPVVDPDDVPRSPTSVLPEGESGGLLDVPASVGAEPNRPDPNLTPPEGQTRAEQLQEEIDTAERGAQQQFDEEQRQRYQRSFGPRNRAQVVFAQNGGLAYATVPSSAIRGPAGYRNMTSGLQAWTSAGKQIMEVFRISGSNIHIAVADDGERLAFGDPVGGIANKVIAEIDRLAGLAKPIDLVADQMGDYLIISGTELYSSGVPQGAVDWAESELADGIQVTAMALLNGDAWIGVSNREVASGGMNRAHWGRDLLTDIRGFVAAGERIEDIQANVATVSDKWAIATDKRIFVRGFPECEEYGVFGASVESNLSREWDCFYEDRDCLLGRATWSEQDMGSKPDPSIWEVNLLVTIGATEYDGGPKAKDDFECWLEEGLQRTELLFGDSPRLKIRLRTQRESRVDGVDLSNFVMETDTEYTDYMDHNFDIMAKSKTEGYYQLLVSNSICIGYDSDGSRHCIGGRAKFPHSVSPLTRKHGIIVEYPDDRDHVLAHEFGHYLGLIHTFQRTSAFSTALRCNYEYLDENVSNLKCASCRNGIINSTDETCSGDYNVMDYCDGDNDRAYLNQCQKDRAASQRDAYLTNGGQTNYFKMKGRQGEPYCDEDGDCLSDEYCNKGIASIGRNVCKSKLDNGAACSHGGQCESGKCPLLVCKAN